MRQIILKTLNTFNQKQCITHASSLAFSSTLSFIPLLTLSSWSIFHNPQLKKYQDITEKFVIDTIMNNPNKNITTNIQSFIQQSTELPILELMIISIVIWMLWHNIEGVFNYLFDCEHKTKNWFKSIIMALIVLISPTIIATSFAISATLEINQQTITSITFFFVTKLISFCLIYLLLKLLPNCKITNEAAIIGSITTIILLISAKTCFTWYIAKNSFYNIIYGAYTAIPLFLLWLFIAWIIILLGASMVKTINYKDIKC